MTGLNVAQVPGPFVDLHFGGDKAALRVLHGNRDACPRVLPRRITHVNRDISALPSTTAPAMLRLGLNPYPFPERAVDIVSAASIEPLPLIPTYMSISLFMAAVESKTFFMSYGDAFACEPMTLSLLAKTSRFTHKALALLKDFSLKSGLSCDSAELSSACISASIFLYLFATYPLPAPSEAPRPRNRSFSRHHTTRFLCERLPNQRR